MWHTTTIDFAGPFQPSGLYNQISVVVDRLSKRTHFIASNITDKATDTGNRFWDHVVKFHGVPAVMVSDRDAKFISLFWNTLFTRFDTKLARLSAYHPRTDGQSEVKVKTLKDMLRYFINQKQDIWSQQLAALEFAFNNAVHSTTGYTPFELDLGYILRQTHQMETTEFLNVVSVEDFIEQQMAIASIVQNQY
jgi:hypothetical protein